MCERDYNLLRPFDLEAANRGDAILWIGGQWEPATFVGRSRSDETNIIEYEEMRTDSIYRVLYATNEYLRMAPLCWVEGKPVYKGDVLWNKYRRDKVIAGSINNEVFLCEPGERTGDCIDNLTWTQPKVKREGWINIYGCTHTIGNLSMTSVSDTYPTRKDADDNAAINRKACIHIEWEE